MSILSCHMSKAVECSNSGVFAETADGIEHLHLEFAQ